MLNELKLTLSIILVSCTIGPSCSSVKAASAVSYSSSNANDPVIITIVRETGGFDPMTVEVIKVSQTSKLTKYWISEF